MKAECSVYVRFQVSAEGDTIQELADNAVARAGHAASLGGGLPDVSVDYVSQHVDIVSSS